jgi:hypothetical protein
MEGFEMRERMGTNEERRWGLCHLGKRKMRERRMRLIYLRRRESRVVRGSSNMLFGEEGKWTEGESEIRD